MYFEWWQITLMGLLWIVSLISFGRAGIKSGAIRLLAQMDQLGFIHITKDGTIIGLNNYSSPDSDNQNDNEK